MARNPNTPKNASFATPATKPVDIAYRIKRLGESVEDAKKFLNAIDVEAGGNADIHKAVAFHLSELEKLVVAYDDARPLTRTERKEG